MNAYKYSNNQIADHSITTFIALSGNIFQKTTEESFNKNVGSEHQIFLQQMNYS